MNYREANSQLQGRPFEKFLAFVDAVSLKLYSTQYHELTNDQREKVKAQVLFLHFGEPCEVAN